MSIEGLFDHVVRVWRPVSTAGRLREEVRTYEPLGAAPTEFNAAVTRPRMPYANLGAGLAPVGARTVYMAAETDVEALDVLQVLSGPDGSPLLQVDEPPTRPRGHHVELRCAAWLGKLSEGGS